MARHVAKAMVAAGLAERALVQIAYAIGEAQPVSVLVDSYGTGTLSDAELEALLTARLGSLGELFGVVRQVSGDASSVIYQSLISSQYPGRDEFFVQLA